MERWYHGAEGPGEEEDNRADQKRSPEPQVTVRRKNEIMNMKPIQKGSWTTIVLHIVLQGVIPVVRGARGYPK